MEAPSNGTAQAVKECTAHMQRMGFVPNILIVEDCETDWLLWERYVKRFHCRLTRARDGREALLLIKAQRFDLVLLDMALGDMTGLMVLRVVGTLSRFVVITGAPDSPDAQEATQGDNGAFYVLTKSENPNIMAFHLVAIFGTLVAVTHHKEAQWPKWVGPLMQTTGKIVPTLLELTKFFKV